jgi:hypothetical protein
VKRAPSGRETKECPFCAETIKAAAVLCRFCGRELSLTQADSALAAKGTAVGPAQALPSAPGVDQSEIFDLLTALVEKSLVGYEETEQGKGRYRLLETVRQYSRDRLLEVHEGTALRERHSAVFRAFAEETIRELSRKQPVAWLGRLEREYDNLRAALDWTLGSDPSTALRLAGLLGRFWTVRSHLTEGREWLERALETATEAPPSVRAEALLVLLQLLHWQGEHQRLPELGEECRVLAQQSGDKKILATALGGLAEFAYQQEDRQRAGRLLDQCLTLAREVQDPWLTGHVSILAAGLGAKGINPQTTVTFEQAQTACRATRDPYLIAICCRTEGFYALRRGDHGHALARCREGIAAARAVGHRVGVHNGLLVRS